MSNERLNPKYTEQTDATLDILADIHKELVERNRLLREKALAKRAKYLADELSYSDVELPRIVPSVG